jgi:hypothetical protein
MMKTVGGCLSMILQLQMMQYSIFHKKHTIQRSKKEVVTKMSLSPEAIWENPGIILQKSAEKNKSVVNKHNVFSRSVFDC